ncbi:hypothetical protein OSB04_013271 [Centaurea solstitialis]|uniref:Uncharacterized protein n=1 Tax=Centaurea solstitialis TaxID=347529 RepID=A0AA38TVZ2_9ASTR|nr:hypothetical protein OSB04_013271 [Centaurea solstitialis]
MVMKEYKNPASWTMLYHIHYEDIDLGKPLRLRNNSDMIVELKNRDIIMFNHDKGGYFYVFRDGEEEEEEDFYPRTYVHRYEESLALLDVGDSVPNREAMEALMMIENQASSSTVSLSSQRRTDKRYSYIYRRSTMPLVFNGTPIQFAHGLVLPTTPPTPPSRIYASLGPDSLELFRSRPSENCCNFEYPLPA